MYVLNMKSMTVVQTRQVLQKMKVILCQKAKGPWKVMPQAFVEASTIVI